MPFVRVSNGGTADFGMLYFQGASSNPGIRWYFGNSDKNNVVYKAGNSDNFSTIDTELVFGRIHNPTWEHYYLIAKVPLYTSSSPSTPCAVGDIVADVYRTGSLVVAFSTKPLTT